MNHDNHSFVFLQGILLVSPQQFSPTFFFNKQQKWGVAGLINEIEKLTIITGVTFNLVFTCQSAIVRTDNFQVTKKKLLPETMCKTISSFQALLKLSSARANTF
jgi:hypothetical protein